MKICHFLYKIIGYRAEMSRRQTINYFGQEVVLSTNWGWRAYE